MKKNLFSFCLGAAAMAAVAGTISLAQPGSDKKTPPAGMPEMKLPPGWTEADMAACMKAFEESNTPGPMHKFLADGAGKWYSKNKMWMAPGMDPEMNESTSTLVSILDGKFVKLDVEGSTSMGPFNGLGLYGYDNTTKKFQSAWLSNCGTAMMFGNGELSADQKTMTWTYNFTCPVTKKPTTMREVHKHVSADSQTIDMYGMDPKTGKEFKMMEMTLTRKK